MLLHARGFISTPALCLWYGLCLNSTCALACSPELPTFTQRSKSDDSHGPSRLLNIYSVAARGVHGSWTRLLPTEIDVDVPVPLRP